MHNKFKKGTIVVVNGVGKCNDKRYYNMIGIVIERDPFFKDYHILFEDGSKDWLDDKFLEKLN